MNDQVNSRFDVGDIVTYNFGGAPFLVRLTEKYDRYMRVVITLNDRQYDTDPYYYEYYMREPCVLMPKDEYG